jgi:hypothetical protein
MSNKPSKSPLLEAERVSVSHVNMGNRPSARDSSGVSCEDPVWTEPVALATAVAPTAATSAHLARWPSGGGTLYDVTAVFAKLWVTSTAGRRSGTVGS